MILLLSKNIIKQVSHIYFSHFFQFLKDVVNDWNLKPLGASVAMYLSNGFFFMFDYFRFGRFNFDKFKFILNIAQLHNFWKNCNFVFIILLLSYIFKRLQEGSSTSTERIWERMRRFEERQETWEVMQLIWLNCQRHLWSNMERKIYEILCIQACASITWS